MVLLSYWPVPDVVPLSYWLVPVRLVDEDNGSCPAVRLLPKWLPVLIFSVLAEFHEDSKLTLAGAIVRISYIGIPSVNGVIRSARAIHDFVVFLASRITAQESSISRLNIVDA